MKKSIEFDTACILSLIPKEGRLSEKSTCANIALVQLEGTRKVKSH
jgi:hypothetical protein